MTVLLGEVRFRHIHICNLNSKCGSSSILRIVGSHILDRCTKPNATNKQQTNKYSNKTKECFQTFHNTTIKQLPWYIPHPQQSTTLVFQKWSQPLIMFRVPSQSNCLTTFDREASTYYVVEAEAFGIIRVTDTSNLWSRIMPTSTHQQEPKWTRGS